MAGCTTAGKQATDTARGLGDDATAVFIVGAVAAAAGAVVWATAPRAKSSTSARLYVQPGSIVLAGEF
jgi:hypothetical protein